ncbi:MULTISPECIES: tetratricopeptide repeat protein [Ramlibacter]|uniref:Tetratricopeptide repeat protein n=1 Tax=Ramlibacter aquaticus TaxID=2780094 RepID=A0ABR9SCM0_9BURK|nr:MULTISPECIES: tetratricopeptide repeat protein [Ramlibacter]MBE7940083.1 tetratricopeptide repeat protein [Ramlibacter aquaticus]
MNRARVRHLVLAALALLTLPALADDFSDIQQLMKAGQPAQALARTEQAITTTPRDARLRFLKGVLLADLGRRSEAVQAYTELTQDFPELPEPYNNLAALYAATGDYDKARAALESAVRANPGYGTAYENLGDVYLRLAAQAYTRAQQLGPDGTGAGAKLAQVRQLFGPARPAVPAAAPAAPAASSASAAAR